MLVEARDRMYTRMIRSSFGSMGHTSRVDVPFIAFGERQIHIGDHVTVGAGSLFNASKTAQIVIGSNTHIGGNLTLIAWDRVEIGPNVIFARGVTVIDHQHRTADPEVPISAQGWDQIAPVEIKRGAWLGTNAVVMPGVTIGRNAIVGANAVVTRDVPDHGVAVGAPARLLERRSYEYSDPRGLVGM